MCSRLRQLAVIALLAGITVACRQQPVTTEPDPDFWHTANVESTEQIDHTAWQQLLSAAVADVADDVNLVDYAAFAGQHKAALDSYIASLAAIDPRRYAHDEQMAYWINLYNALTVQRVARDWPVTSILNVGSLTRQGPWDEPLVRVAGMLLSLNDIEHGILRRVWDEPRIHFAVNCASVGCPDLSVDAYRGSELDAQLQTAARSYLASERGVAWRDETLQLSAIFEWYADDFGASESAVIKHLAALADTQTRDRLLSHDGDVVYDYDWSINARH
ncbi:MAG: DUF547 domain-containing protein [Pseudomonadota bacterium]